MPVTASSAPAPFAAKHGGKILDLSGAQRGSQERAPAPAVAPPVSVEAIDQPATVKAHREARFLARHGHQGRYDQGLDVDVDRDDIQEVQGEAYANLHDQHVMKAAGTGASKVSPSYQSKPKSVRMH